MHRLVVTLAIVGLCKQTCATLFDGPAVSAEATTSSTSVEDTTTALAPMSRAKRQCGGMGGCCAGMCGQCGGMGMCGQVCCAQQPSCSCGNPGCSCLPAAPPPCVCGTPSCSCTTNTQLVAVQQTCCTCCRPVCTQACIQGGGCGCGCTRGGCGRKRRSLLAIAAEEADKQ
ncbi:unnamed protein product, partial [Mesorhabditis spiculigera]